MIRPLFTSRPQPTQSIGHHYTEERLLCPAGRHKAEHARRHAEGQEAQRAGVGSHPLDCGDGGCGGERVREASQGQLVGCQDSWWTWIAWAAGGTSCLGTCVGWCGISRS